jgi:hypothetical protein
MDFRCILKAFGVILLHFKVDKMNQGVIVKKIFFKGLTFLKGFQWAFEPCLYTNILANKNCRELGIATAN